MLIVIIMDNIDSKLVCISGIARGLTTSVLYPVDTIKSRLQYSSTIKSSLYKGFVYTVSTQTIYGMIVFGTYENLKKSCGHQNVYVHIRNAIISDLLGSIFLCPCEVIKQNVQVGHYRSAVDVFRHSNAAFYKGYYSLIGRDLPFRMIQLPMYEHLKKQDNSMAGCIAGMTAAAITNPIDVVKTQLMCGSYKSFRDTFAHKGIAMLFAGIVQRTVYLGASSAIFFYLFESLRV
jgi:solute carrier family 25 S-adenosylmethionine transporter 26